MPGLTIMGWGQSAPGGLLAPQNSTFHPKLSHTLSHLSPKLLFHECPRGPARVPQGPSGLVQQCLAGAVSQT